MGFKYKVLINDFSTHGRMNKSICTFFHYPKKTFSSKEIKLIIEEHFGSCKTTCRSNWHQKGLMQLGLLDKVLCEEPKISQIRLRIPSQDLMGCTVSIHLKKTTELCKKMLS